MNEEITSTGALLRRPTMGLAAAVMAGTGVGLACPVLAPPLLCAAGLLLVPSLVFVHKRYSSFLILLIAALLSCANAVLHARPPSLRQLDALLDRPGEYLRVIGLISDDPQSAPYEGKGDPPWDLVLNVEGIRRLEIWQQAAGRIVVRCRIPADRPIPRYGERWVVDGLLKKRDPTPGRLKRPDLYELNADADTARMLSSGHGSKVIAWCFAQRHACSRILGLGLDRFPDTAGLLRALLLGQRQELDDSYYRDFSVTGTIHIFAISGTHIVVMAGLCLAVLRAMGIPRMQWALFLAPMLVLYTIGTGMAASAIRACIMALVFWSADLFGRKPDSLTALAFSALLIVVCAPAQLFDLGFILSFSAVGGLILLYPWFNAPVARLFKADPWQVAPEPGWKQRMRAFGKGLATLFTASVAAWLATTPLTALYFNLMSPVALVANLFVIPGSFFVMLTGCLTLVTGGWWPFAAEVFNHANRVFFDALLWVIDVAADVPLGHSFVVSPPLALLAVWYGALLAGVAAHRRSPRIAAALLALALLASTAWYWRSSRDSYVDILDVGQGNAALIKPPGGRGVLVDSGSVFYARRVLWHMRRQGINGLHALVLTHADAEHMGGASEIMASVPVDELWFSPYAGRSPKYKQAIQQACDAGIRLRRLCAGQQGRLPGGLSWEILYPPDGLRFAVADEAALVLRVAGGEDSILFMSDAGQQAEALMLEGAIEPAANVLVAGSHGAVTATSGAWLDAVAPRLAIISVGADNTRGDPSPDLIQRLAIRGIPTVRTDRDGAVRIPLGRGAPAPGYLAIP